MNPAAADALAVTAQVTAALTCAPPPDAPLDVALDHLHEIARTQPLSVARLVEGHVDACRIIVESGAVPAEGLVYGIWASSSDVTAADLVLDGVKAFCSGADVVDRGIVSAGQRDGGAQVLIEVDLRADGVTVTSSEWATHAMADTRTAWVRFDQVAGLRRIGAPGFYLGRPGFWPGALGPAACWAGGAAGLVDVAERLVDDDPHRRAHLGAMRAAVHGSRALLLDAARQLGRPSTSANRNAAGGPERVARSVRHLIERSATDVLDRFGRAFGPRPHVAESDVGQRVADLHLYLRQDHGERDLEALGRLRGPDAG